MTVGGKLIFCGAGRHQATAQSMTVARMKPLCAWRLYQHRLTGEEQSNHQGDELGHPSHSQHVQYHRSESLGM